MARPIVTGMKIEGYEETARALRELGPEAEAELKAAEVRIAKLLASKVKGAGRSKGRQAAVVAGSVRAITGRSSPTVQIGGSSPRGSGGGTAQNLLFGSEFGMSGQGGAGEGTRNFRPHGFLSRVRSGMWIYPTIAANNRVIFAEWERATDEIVQGFGGDF